MAMVEFVQQESKVPEEGPSFRCIFKGADREFGRLYQELDGFFVFEFMDAGILGEGCFEERFFLEIYKKLHELNEPWDSKIRKELLQIAADHGKERGDVSSGSLDNQS